jgi:hypothetical protein
VIDWLIIVEHLASGISAIFGMRPSSNHLNIFKSENSYLVFLKIVKPVKKYYQQLSIPGWTTIVYTRVDNNWHQKLDCFYTAIKPYYGKRNIICVIYTAIKPYYGKCNIICVIFIQVFSNDWIYIMSKDNRTMDGKK